MGKRLGVCGGGGGSRTNQNAQGSKSIYTPPEIASLHIFGTKAKLLVTRLLQGAHVDLGDKMAKN